MRMVTKIYLAELLGVSTRTLDRVDTLPPGFPKKIKITKRRVGYSLREVESWLLQQRAAPLVGGRT